MTDDSSAQFTTVCSLPKFCFEVKWDAVVFHFQEVSGLEVESEVIEYRHGDSPQFGVIKMPSIKKYSDVTMKNGVFKSDTKFLDWFHEVKMNTLKRKPVTISLLDEAGAPTMVWTLANAWPKKVSGTDLKSTGNEVAVDIIVISHEGLTSPTLEPTRAMPPPQADVYPPAAFCFAVSIGNNPCDVDCSFSEVSGFSPEIEFETVMEGGENRYVKQLPKIVKYPNLVLKRGVAPLASSLVTWCRDVLEGGLEAGVTTKRVNVSLLDEMGQPLRSWSFENAFPVKWEVDPIQSTTNEVALENVELSYGWTKRVV